ncbi:hypothetical protein [Brevibacillus choshinensis]|uniref:hypothetical protein n=1 Tax=Brevibacillus choshinensis TaxID=54911 RepID=UPI0006EC1A37|nr:hypothetical protein [Brevibacillus choshinensis]
MKKWSAWFLVFVVLLGSGEVNAMEQTPVPPKPSVQHMQVMTKSTDSIVIVDTWQDIQRKHSRMDIVQYGLTDEAVIAMNQHREVILYQNEKPFEIARSQGEKAEISMDIQDPYNIRNNKNPLFEAVVRWYSGARWERTGTVEFNGRQVNRLTYTREGSQPAVTIAYIDPDTGLPVKEEDYIGGNSTPATTKMYVFEEIDDPTGFLFTRAATPLLERDAANWFCLALDAVMPLDTTLNSNLNYIVVDMSDVPGFHESGKKQVLQYFEKYKVKTMEASLEQLREEGLYNRENTGLAGLLLRINKISIFDGQVVLNGFKHRGTGGAIGFRVVLNRKNGQWQVTEAVPTWIS